MKTAVDSGKCIGCGVCSDTCPQAFVLKDGVAVVVATPVPADAEETCRESARNCPVEAITIDE